ncbi:MAG: outer membrane protein assembly factor BamE [Elusimicrobia bacterium]|nr:outer membrane protein assembly factor BamE [Elusimicrobiota bacterium]
MKMNKLALYALLAAALGTAACVTVGGKFNSPAANRLEPGKTTQEEALKTFGQPFRTGVDSGDAAWTYVDYHFSIFGQQKATDLVLRFDQNGILKSYTYNSTEP